jgi:hypothetical protein
MKFIKLVLLSLIIFCAQTIAQNRNTIWCFGDSSGIDFGTGTIPTTFRTSVVSRGGCVSIADSMGNLLFYANTAEYSTDSSTKVYPSGQLHIDKNIMIS